MVAPERVRRSNLRGVEPSDLTRLLRRSAAIGCTVSHPTAAQLCSQTCSMGARIASESAAIGITTLVGESGVNTTCYLGP